MNIRKQTLEEANKCVNGQRTQDYGTPEDSFKTIAGLWNAYFQYQSKGIPNIKATDVALMLALLKVARLTNDKTHKDSWVDLAGYAACGAECALPVKEQYNDYMEPNSPAAGSISNNVRAAMEAQQMASIRKQSYPPLSGGISGVGSVHANAQRYDDNYSNVGRTATARNPQVPQFLNEEIQTYGDKY
jgi:hypothetical protein